MKVAFTLPSTPSCRVLYVRDGVTYAAVLSTPRSCDELLITMLNRKVGVSQIKDVQPIQPLAPLKRQHPAEHRMAQYASAADS